MFKKIFKIKNKNKDIILRPVKLRDVNKNYLSWFKDKNIKKFINFNPENLDDLKKNTSNFLSKKNIFFYAILINKIHVGNIKIDNIDYASNKATLGILIGNKKFRNIGVGFAVIKFILKLFNEKKIYNIYLGCDKTNLQALKLYFNCGFKIIKKNKKNLLLVNKFVSNKIILGGAQFNSSYGITNFKKKTLSPTIVKKIIHYSIKNGVREIDIAEDYLFNPLKYQKLLKGVLINTKLSSNRIHLNYKDIEKKFLNYKKNNLKINLVFIHDGDNLLTVKGKKLLKILKKLKQKKLISGIGISIYNFNIIKKLSRLNRIEAIQLPYNLIDKRFNKFQKILIKLDIKVQARSIFLQGSMIKKVKSNKYLSEMYDKMKIYSLKINQSLHQMCLNHAISNSFIDKIVVGVRSLNEAKMLINVTPNKKKYKISFNRRLKKKVINPTIWS